MEFTRVFRYKLKFSKTKTIRFFSMSQRCKIFLWNAVVWKTVKFFPSQKLTFFMSSESTPYLTNKALGFVIEERTFYATCLVSSESWRNKLPHSFVNEKRKLSQKAWGPSFYTKTLLVPSLLSKISNSAAIFENIAMQLCDARWPGVE